MLGLSLLRSIAILLHTLNDPPPPPTPHSRHEKLDRTLSTVPMYYYYYYYDVIPAWVLRQWTAAMLANLHYSARRAARKHTDLETEV
jgi:hypothetical protein